MQLVFPPLPITIARTRRTYKSAARGCQCANTRRSEPGTVYGILWCSATASSTDEDRAMAGRRSQDVHTSFVLAFPPDYSFARSEAATADCDGAVPVAWRSMDLCVHAVLGVQLAFRDLTQPAQCVQRHVLWADAGRGWRLGDAPFCMYMSSSAKPTLPSASDQSFARQGQSQRERHLLELELEPIDNATRSVWFRIPRRGCGCKASAVRDRVCVVTLPGMLVAGNASPKLKASNNQPARPWRLQT